MDSRFSEKRSYEQLWTHRGNKFVIGTLHGNPIEIIAQYNPKELSRQAAATWTPHQNTSASYAENSESHMWSEYKTTAPRTLTFELLFDGYEEGMSVAPIVESLERLTIPVNMSSRDVTERRPQLCVAVWGTQQMRCVVQSVATKLTMFDESGEPLRASCTVALTEVDVAAMMKVDSSAVQKISQKGGGYKHVPRDHSKSPYPPEDSKPTRVPRTSDPTASDTASARGDRESPSQRSAAAGTNAKSATPAAASAPAPVSSPAPAAQPPEPAPASPISAAAPASAPAAADAPATGTPSAQVDPNAMDGEGDHVFVGEQPAPAVDDEPARGKPSAQVDPNSMDGKSPVFGGKPSAQVDPNSMDGQSDVFGEQPAPDAVSGADPESPDAKRMAVYKDLE
jgi:hypothetical protein